ncbi:MAG: YajD family HNH nuclease [Gallionella sp.]
MQSLQENDNGQRTATQDQGSKETQEAASTRQTELILLVGSAAMPGQNHPDMPRKPDQARLDRVVAEARRLSDEREATYRERALKLFPWICGRCGREFSGARLRELTVHHKDHDHDNNPADGSNWELLCLYCHDNEHMRLLEQQSRPDGSENQPSTATHNPFATLKSLLKNKD